MNGSDEVSRRVLAASMMVGATLGVAVLWLLQPDPPACTTLDSGMRACMPVLVVPPPGWAYAAAGVAGALTGLVVSMLASWMIRATLRAGAR